MGILLGTRRRASRSKAAAKKHKWEKPLTESERAFVASLNPLLISLARKNTPIRFRHNELAIEQSYLVGFKSLCRSAQTYDPTKSAPTTYVYDQTSMAIRNFWRSNRQFSFDLGWVTENVSTPSGENLPMTGEITNDGPTDFESIANAEECELVLAALKAFRPEWHTLVSLRFGFRVSIGFARYAPKFREYHEVAEILGKSVECVSWTLRQATRFMKMYARGLR